jgi:uncharacterized membrane protein
MDGLIVARALHVVAVVHWIGGVTMVTLVLLPAVLRLPVAERRLEVFEAVEGRFAGQAKISTTIAGLTGFFMTHEMAAWDRFVDPAFWWMHAMVALWLVFTVILFVAEPLFLHRWFQQRAMRDPQGTLALILRFHGILLAISAVTVGGAVLGAHGITSWAF